MKGFLPSLEPAPSRPLVLWLLLAVLVSTGVFSPACRAEGNQGTREIREVRFEGLKTLTAEELLRKIQSRPGTTYDPERVRRDLKSLAPLAWNWPSVRARDVEGGLDLVFFLRENPTLEELRIVGNSKIETGDLERTVRIKPGDVLTRDAVSKTERAIRKAYQSRGYLRTEVKATLAAKPESVSSLEEPDSKILQVFVNEGRKIKIDDLEILGNEHFSDLRLKMALETKGSWLFAKNYFDETAYESDLETLRQLYQRSGFFDARVDRGVFHEDEERGTISPTIIVSEGARYRFGNFATRGNTFFTREEIEVFLNPLRGKKFNGKDYDVALRKIGALYANEGFVTTEIVDSLDFDRDRGEVHVTLNIDENARAEIGNILVERNEMFVDEDASWFARTYQRVAPPVDNQALVREITLRPGDVYDKRRETESVARLRRLGIFDRVEIESRATDDPRVRDVLIRVEEGVTGNVMFGVGYSEYFGGYLMASYRERNFLGQADSLLLNVLAGTEVVNGSVTYFDRRLGDTKKSLLLELRRIRAHRPGFDEINTGVLVELGIPWKYQGIDEIWKTYLRGRLEFVQIDESTYDPIEDFDTSYPVAALRARLVHDTRTYEDYRGSRSFENGGHLHSIAFEGGYADGMLAKLTGKFHWFRKVGDKMIFSTDWRVGLMPVDADDIGPSERFYMGGVNDLRGFQWRQAGPHDKGDDEVPLGGATKILTRNELRYPLSDTITGLIFLDAGMLGHDAFSFSSPRVSTGLGVRLDLRNFQAGVDLALPLSSHGDDQKRYFHFNLSALTGYQR